MLSIDYCAAVNIEADDSIKTILERVRALNARRVVIDGITDLESAILEKERVRPMLSSLLVQLRRMDVTAIFIKEVPKLSGADIDFSDTPIPITAENMLFIRHLERRGRLVRVASVLKMRESDYDPYVRQFEITDDGIRVLGPLHIDGVGDGTLEDGRA